MNCEIRDNGGCYCLCRLIDYRNRNYQVMKPDHTGIINKEGGYTWYADENEFKKDWDNLKKEDRDWHINYITNEAPLHIKELDRRIKEYEDLLYSSI